VKRALLAVAVPAILLGGNLATRGLLLHPPGRLAGELAQPLPVVTAWGGYGAELFAIFALTLASAAGAAFLYAWTIREAPAAPSIEGTTWLCAIASLLAVFAWPVVYSSDVYAYAAYGEMALHGVDVYLPVPAGFHAPFVDLARRQWSGTFPPCIYGTLFVALARGLVALFGGRDPASTLLAFRAFATTAWLGAAYVFSLLARRWFSERRTVALALFVLNPLGIWCAAEGHNDALMVLIVLLGTLAIARGAFFAGGLALGLTPLLKAAGAAAGIPLALYVAARARRSALFVWIGYVAGLAAAAGLLVEPMWPALTALRVHGTYAPQVSLQSLSGAIPSLALAALATLTGLRALARGDSSGALWLALAVPLALPNPYPWYMMWVLPVAAAARGPAGTWLWIGTIAGSLRYLPDAFGPLRSDSNVLATIVCLIPFAVTAVALLRAPLARPQARLTS
jgi:hypothetical protein